MTALEKYAAKQHLTQQLAKTAGALSQAVMLGKSKPRVWKGGALGALLAGPLGGAIGIGIQGSRAAKYERQALLRKVLLGAGAAGAAGAYAASGKK